MSYNFTNYRYYVVQKISKLYLSYKTETVPIEQQLITSPCPKYLATTILVFISVSLTILDISYMWKYVYLSFCGWLISQSIMSSKFIHFIVCIGFPFLRPHNISCYIYICDEYISRFLCLFIHQWNQRAFRLFPLSDIVNHITVNMEVLISL